MSIHVSTHMSVLVSLHKAQRTSYYYHCHHHYCNIIIIIISKSQRTSYYRLLYYIVYYVIILLSLSAHHILEVRLIELRMFEQKLLLLYNNAMQKTISSNLAPRHVLQCV